MDDDFDFGNADTMFGEESLWNEEGVISEENFFGSPDPPSERDRNNHATGTEPQYPFHAVDARQQQYDPHPFQTFNASPLNHPHVAYQQRFIPQDAQPQPDGPNHSDYRQNNPPVATLKRKHTNRHQLQLDHPPSNDDLHPSAVFTGTEKIWVTVQPARCWYQFKEGQLTFSMKTSDPAVIDACWSHADLKLLYNDTKTCVPIAKKPAVSSTCPEPAVSSTFKEVSRLVQGDTVTFQLKVGEITKNHQSREFCFSIRLGDVTIVTNAFEVMTKRTKRKKRKTKLSSDTEYMTHAKSVLVRLQWRVSGYKSSCEGTVDLTRPIFTCVLCDGNREQGHGEDCPIIPLL